MRLSSWRFARRAGRNGDSRARPFRAPPGTRDATVRQVTRRWMLQAVRPRR